MRVGRLQAPLGNAATRCRYVGPRTTRGCQLLSSWADGDEDHIDAALCTHPSLLWRPERHWRPSACACGKLAWGYRTQP